MDENEIRTEAAPRKAAKKAAPASQPREPRTDIVGGSPTGRRSRTLLADATPDAPAAPKKPRRKAAPPPDESAIEPLDAAAQRAERAEEAPAAPKKARKRASANPHLTETASELLEAAVQRIERAQDAAQPADAHATAGAERPDIPAPDMTFEILGEDGAVLIELPERRGPEHPFSLHVVAKSRVALPGEVSLHFTLPNALEPHIQNGQIELTLERNGKPADANLAIDWSPSTGKLDLYSKAVLGKNDALELRLPVHTRNVGIPDNGFLVYGDLRTGDAEASLPLAHVAKVRRVADVRASAFLQAGAEQGESVALDESGTFALQIELQALHASGNLTIDIPLPVGIEPTFTGNAPLFLAALDGRPITTRGGLWDGAYDPAYGARFTFFDIAAGKPLIVQLPLRALATLDMPEEGETLFVRVAMEGNERIAELPLSVRAGAWSRDAAPQPRAVGTAKPSALAFCPLAQPF